MFKLVLDSRPSTHVRVVTIMEIEENNNLYLLYIFVRYIMASVTVRINGTLEQVRFDSNLV